MKDITFALLSVMLWGLSMQQCNPGCLRCSNTNTCLACDTTRNTFLRQNTCYTTTLTNCQTMAQNNTCIQCNPGYALNMPARTCSIAGSTIINCAVYATANTCKVCVDGAIMIAGQCRLNARPILNCQSYNPDGTCLRCSPTFVVAANLTACVPLNINNCQQGSFIRCRQCINGFVYSNNTYLFNLFQFDLAQYAANNLNSFKGGPWFPQSFCQNTFNVTCLDPLSLNCLPQVIAGAQPNLNAVDPNYIVNCATYGPAFACTKCVQGFKLATATSCTPVTPVNNCTEYSAIDATGNCVACVNGMFVQANQCVARVNNNIPGCASYSPAADTCATCIQNLIKSTDGYTCFPPLPNCKDHLPMTAYYPQNNCILCNPGFFINATKNVTICSNGTVPNCTIFNAYDNSCQVCRPGTYLNNGICSPHKPIQGCKEYTLTSGIKCKTCDGNRIPFNIVNKCVPMTPRANCVDYNAAGDLCTACNGTNYLTAAGACAAIPAANVGCISWNAATSVCTGCAPGLHLNTLGAAPTCDQPIDYVVGNSSRCAIVDIPVNPATWTAGSNTQTKCAACNETSFPYTPSFNEAICARNNQLYYTVGWTSVTNCARYGRSLAAGNPTVCMECNRGFFISDYQALGPYTLATTCVSTCASPANAVILDDFFGFLNICVPILDTGIVRLSATCAKYVRVAAGNILAGDTTYSLDFVCLNAVANAAGAVYPVTYLLYDMIASLAVTAAYEKVVLWSTTGSNTLPATWDFSNGFANTVDTTLTYPLVFNYKGLLTTTQYGGNAFIRPSVAADAISAATVKLNTFTNCDIVTNTDLVKVGNAFHGAATLYSPATIGTVYYHCFRCAFGFGLTYTAGTTVALTSPFPSCAALTGCTAAAVHGGLPRILNSLFSCHVCTSTGAIGNFPTIALEIDAVSGSGLVIGFQPDQAIGGTVATRTINARSGFKCATAPTTVVTSNTAASIVTIAKCAAYANIRALSAYATATDAATVVTTVHTAANNNICIACAAGFFPVYLATSAGTEAASFTSHSLPGWTVTDCQASQYCDPRATGMFNGCPRCDPSKSPLTGGGVAYNDYSLANCVFTPTNDCLIAEGILHATTIYPCTFCKGGFFLGASGMCEQLTIPNQASGPSFYPNAFIRLFTSTTLAAPSNTMFSMKDLRIAYLQKINGTNYGAANCTAGYTKMPINPLVQAVCTVSSFLNSTRMRFDSNPYYIPNCAKYKAQTALAASAAELAMKCYECLAPFVATLDGTQCILFPVPTLCRYAQSPPYTAPSMVDMPQISPNPTPLCAECQTGSINVNGICLIPTIANCLTYQQTTTTGTLPIVCTVCRDTFAPNAAGTACNKGPVEFCRVYSNALTCTSCLPGTILINLKGRPYCLTTPANLNCTQVDASQSNAYNFVCTRCNNTQVTAYSIAAFTPPNSVDGDPADTCLPFNNITNCLIYAYAGRDNAGVVNFGCQACSPRFYWDDANLYCKERTVLPIQCVEFNLAADLCTACAASFTLNAAGTTCTAYPTGIQNCFSYSSDGICGSCVTGFYLNGGNCLQVARSVPFCMFYSSEGVCAKCGLGRVAVNNGTLCDFPIFTNCTTWETPESCSSCPPTMFLNKVTRAAVAGTATVQAVPALTFGVCINITVGNCSIAGANKDSCSRCMDDFFLSAGKCAPVLVKVIGCANYTNATHCQSCGPGFVLNFNGASCVPNNFDHLADNNCADSFVDSRPICVACNPGYYFNHQGNCVQCGQIPTGCAYCNPMAPDQCMLCATGYTMDSNFACNVQASIPNNPPPA